MAERYIRFIKLWGKKAWSVEYEGPYSNKRPPHVEVVGFSPRRGQVCRLQNLRAISGRALAWQVEGVTNDGSPAHFTVYYGEDIRGEFQKHL